MKIAYALSIAAVAVPVLKQSSAAADTRSFAQTVVDDGAIAFWQLNEGNTTNGATAASTVNSGTYNGTYQTGTPSGVTVGTAPYAAMGTAAYFHNTSANTTVAGSDAVIASASGLPAGNANRTIVLWERDSLTTAQNFYQVQMDYGKLGGGPNHGAVVPLLYPNATGEGFTNYGSTINTDSPVVDDNAWHFIAITADSTGQAAGSTVYKLYVDGALIFTEDPIPQNTVLDQTTIGTSTVLTPNAVNAWDGGLSNVAIFGTALSADDIHTLYLNAPNVAPEPASLGLLAISGLGLLARRRKA